MAGEDQMNTPTWISLASALIALIALFRPEISTILRGWLNRIEYFPLNKVEIGFSTFGPTIGLVGTLRGAPNDQFVKSVSLVLVRDKDRSTHKFEWAVFRSTSIVGDTKDIQVASGFSLRDGDSRTLNIQFWDNDTRHDMEPSLERLRQPFRDFILRSKINLAQTSSDELTRIFQQDFQKEDPNLHGSVWAEIGRNFYWETGSYRLTVVIETWDPQKRFAQDYTFRIESQEAETLRINAVGAMHGAIGVDVRYNFINPVLTPI